MQKKKQYPTQYTAKDFSSQYGLRVHDCVGLIKGYLWTNENGKLTYIIDQDKDVSGMLQNCNEIGSVSNIPETEGLLLFKKGHVGIYIGGGKVIEAKGHKYGVVETNLADGGWQEYGKLKWISYPEEDHAAEPAPATKEEKERAIMGYYGLEPQTIQYFNFYKHGEPLIDKLYAKTQKP